MARIPTAANVDQAPSFRDPGVSVPAVGQEVARGTQSVGQELSVLTERRQRTSEALGRIETTLKAKEFAFQAFNDWVSSDIMGEDAPVAFAEGLTQKFNQFAQEYKGRPEARAELAAALEAERVNWLFKASAESTVARQQGIVNALEATTSGSVRAVFDDPSQIDDQMKAFDETFDAVSPGLPRQMAEEQKQRFRQSIVTSAVHGAVARGDLGSADALLSDRSPYSGVLTPQAVVTYKTQIANAKAQARRAGQQETAFQSDVRTINQARAAQGQPPLNPTELMAVKLGAKEYLFPKDDEGAGSTLGKTFQDMEARYGPDVNQWPEEVRRATFGAAPADSLSAYGKQWRDTVRLHGNDPAKWPAKAVEDLIGKAPDSGAESAWGKELADMKREFGPDMAAWPLEAKRKLFDTPEGPAAKPMSPWGQAMADLATHYGTKDVAQWPAAAQQIAADPTFFTKKEGGGLSRTDPIGRIRADSEILAAKVLEGTATQADINLLAGATEDMLKGGVDSLGRPYAPATPSGTALDALSRAGYVVDVAARTVSRPQGPALGGAPAPQGQAAVGQAQAQTQAADASRGLAATQVPLDGPVQALASNRLNNASAQAIDLFGRAPDLMGLQARAATWASRLPEIGSFIAETPDMTAGQALAEYVRLRAADVMARAALTGSNEEPSPSDVTMKLHALPEFTSAFSNPETFRSQLWALDLALGAEEASVQSRIDDPLFPPEVKKHALAMSSQLGLIRQMLGVKQRYATTREEVERLPPGAIYINPKTGKHYVRKGAGNGGG